MWTCPKCKERIEDQFDSCWKCAGDAQKLLSPAQLTSSMKALVVILWFQLLIGLVGMYVSFAGLHTGAMGMETSSDLRAEYARLRTAPDFRVPPEVRGVSFEELLDWFFSSQQARAHNAGYCMLLSGGVAVLAAVMLWFAYRSRQPIKITAGNSRQASQLTVL
jgi:hypothetical protein